MADSATKTNESMKKKNNKNKHKRKLSNLNDSEKPSKSSRISTDSEQQQSCTVEDTQILENLEIGEEDVDTPLVKGSSHQWRNLELVLSIQIKHITPLKKVELIFEFVNSRASKDDTDTEEFNTFSISRFIVYVSNWIQSLLITSEKKMRAGDKDSEDSQLIMDTRCWEILRVCLEESESLCVSLNLSRDLLRVISCVATNALYSLNFGGTDTKECTFTSENFEVFSTVNECLKLLFSSNRRLLNENLDLWAVAIASLLDLAIRIYTDNHQDSGVGNLVTEFSCLVLEPFSKFLRLHPCRKNGFRDFVDKLLEPLLHLLGLLHDQIRGRSFYLLQNLFTLLEEILSYGLFHSVHLDEYLNLHISDKYLSAADVKKDNVKTIIKSYHRHLFDKVENFVSQRKIHALSGIGELFRLFVVSVKKVKRDSQDAEILKAIDTSDKKHHLKITGLSPEKSNATMTLASEMRKSFFDFFVLTMEPLLLELSKHVQSNLQPGTPLRDVYYILKSVNKILSSLVCERAYLRMEDNSGGACLNFLKTSYDLLMLCYAKFNQLWLSTCGTESSVQVEIFSSMAKEFIYMSGFFLEIEYGVLSDDLVLVWQMILTCLTLVHSAEDVPVDLGCRILNFYSELRQVDRALIALCEGLRHLSFYQEDGGMKCSKLSPSNSLHYDKFSKSGCLLLSSQKFRLAMCNVIKSIPEGQAVDFVHTLSADILGCLEWMKDGQSVIDELELGDSHSCRISAQAKLLGIVFSEIYTLVLDSLPVSAGFSYQMGESIQKLIMVLRPSMKLLTYLEQDGPDGFLLSVFGISSNQNTKCKIVLLDKLPLLLLFFFRVYVTCRSLYHQALSLMPPDSSMKMAKVMADFSTAYSGDNCMERTKFKNKGYFSWAKCSAPLLGIMRSIKDNYIQEGSADHCCLIYVMHEMALQRLVDLNRQINCVEYTLQRSESERIGTLMDDDTLSVSLKNTAKLEKSKKFVKLEKNFFALKEETVGLTSFIMESLPVEDEEQQLTSTPSGKTTNSLAPLYTAVDSWDLGVCAMNEKTLPTAIWWLICQNVDTWCNYASKKKLKLFLSLLILNALPYGRIGELKEQPCSYVGEAAKVTKHRISQKLLHDTTFYDQKFVRRYMASRVCYVFKKCASYLFGDSTNISADLDSSDWTNLLGILKKKAISVRNTPITACAHPDVINEHSDKGTSITTNVHLVACRNLLNLLCTVVEISSSVKSFSRSVVYIINIERFIIDCLLESRKSLCLHEHHEFLRLLVSSRRALKYVLMAFCAGNSEVRYLKKVPILSEVPSSILWLLESMKLVIAWWNTLSSQNTTNQFNDMIVSLMDHTSYVFFILCKHQFGSAIQSILSLDRAGTAGLDYEDSQVKEIDGSTNLLNDEAFNAFLMIVEVLEEETKGSLLFLEETFSSGDVEVDVQSADLKKLYSSVSCIQGFIWGLESALRDILSSDDDLKVKLTKCKHNIMSRVTGFMNTFTELICLSSRIFLHNHLVKQGLLNIDHDNHVGADASLKTNLNYGSKPAPEKQNEDAGSGTITFAASGPRSDSTTGRRKKRLQVGNLHSAISGLTEFGSFKYTCLRIDLLGSFFSGQNLDAAFLLRGLFVASSAILRLSMLIDCSPLSSNLVQNLLGCSEVLLTKFSQMVEFPNPSCFVWLAGTVKFLESMGSIFASTSPTATRIVYTKLVELHLQALGKCISLQGKGAMVASHIESSTKVYMEEPNSKSDLFFGLEHLKGRLRMSFKNLIEKPSEPLQSSALQAVERALVGRREGFSMIYEVRRETTTGGIVSSMVAGAVDCLDLLLEIYKGKNQVNVVKTHINSLLASLFNIVVHLQGPKVFYVMPDRNALNKNPDSGSVVLMCVEVLTRIAGKRAQFHLDSHHVGQSLHKAATLFKDFCHIGAGKASHQSVVTSDGCLEHESYSQVDRKFSVNLYAASCRLLWTVVKHRKSECVRCIALLQNSLQVLLRCLEIVDTVSEDRKASFNWDKEEGVKCASYLRRVYEEIGQQKDVLGQHCFMFLSDYIWLYSGYGPLRRGIKREVDEALRPGLYALLDVCSADDLQYLHTIFGEGSCRSTLANLKDDHKRQQYEGKV